MQDPLQSLTMLKSWEKSYFANLNGYLQYEIIEGLNVKSVLGGDIRDSQVYSHRLLGYDSRARKLTNLHETN